MRKQSRGQRPPLGGAGAARSYDRAGRVGHRRANRSAMLPLSADKPRPSRRDRCTNNPEGSARPGGCEAPAIGRGGRCPACRRAGRVGHRRANRSEVLPLSADKPRPSRRDRCTNNPKGSARPARGRAPPTPLRGEARLGNGPVDRFRAERAEPYGGRCPAFRRADGLATAAPICRGLSTGKLRCRDLTRG